MTSTYVQSLRIHARRPTASELLIQHLADNSLAVEVAEGEGCADTGPAALSVREKKNIYARISRYSTGDPSPKLLLPRPRTARPQTAKIRSCQTVSRTVAEVDENKQQSVSVSTEMDRPPKAPRAQSAPVHHTSAAARKSDTSRVSIMEKHAAQLRKRVFSPDLPSVKPKNPPMHEMQSVSKRRPASAHASRKHAPFVGRIEDEYDVPLSEVLWVQGKGPSGRKF